MPLPPFEEQKQFVVITEAATLDTDLDKAEREIELIREIQKGCDK